MSIRRMNESFDKKFKEEYAPVEEIKEGYELLDGTKVELYKDYYKAVERAKELGLKEAEYGDAYGVSYCMWNTSGDRNEDEEVIAYYKFEGRKPRPLTDDEAERIARDIGVQFEDFDESLKEANEPDLTPKERREFIAKMTKALMGDKFGYSHAEANDIAIKRADALGSDWRVRWGGDIDKEIKQELATTLSKADYEAEYGKDGCLKEDNGRIIKFNYSNGGEHFVGYTVQGELDKIDKQNDYFWFTDDKSDIKNGQVLHGWTLPAYLIDKVKDERVMHIIANESKLKEAFSQSDIDYLKSHKGEKLKKGKYSVEYNEYVDANTNEPAGGSFTLYTNAGRYGKDRTSFKDADELIKYINRHFPVNEGKLKEGKRGFVRKYKGCSIHDAGDVFVCTNEHGLNIGQSRTESGCEGLIDEYIKNKGAKNESKLSERNLTKAERHNRDMERIFANKKKFDDKYADFLKGKGYSDEQIKKLRDADDLSGEIARKFTPDGEQPSAILGKILKESQSQELAQYYRELKDENGFDVARLADAFYKTHEWKEIGFQGDVLFTEKGWDAFKKWAKEKKNIEIKDLKSDVAMDDFLGEGRLTEKKWRYTLKNGRALRDAIETEDYTAILATIQLCYQELNEAGIIDDDDCEEWVEELDWLDVEEMDDEDIDYWLDQLYDVCDNLDVWIPLNEEKCDEDTMNESGASKSALEKKYGVKIVDDSFYNSRTGKVVKGYKMYSADGCPWENGLASLDAVKKECEQWADELLKIKGNGKSIGEDTVKQGSQWVNKGKEGTHGKFKTKKEADAQRKAIWANWKK